MIQTEGRKNYLNQMLAESDVDEALKIKDKVAVFEGSFASYINVDNAILVASGGMALNLVLAALNLKKSDKVVTSGFTCRLVPKTINLHAKSVLSDIDPMTYNLDMKNIKGQNKVIIPIHIYGNPAKMDRLPKGFILEDCAHALGAEYKDKKVGSIGDAGIFSLRKNLAAVAGGVITTNDNSLANRIRKLKDVYEKPAAGFANIFGVLDKRLGYKSLLLYRLYRWNKLRGYDIFRKNRVSDFELAMIIAQFWSIEKFISKTIKNARYLDRKLNRIVGVPKSYKMAKSIYSRYTMLFDEPVNLERLSDIFRKNGFDTGMLYKKEYEYNIENFGGNLPVADNISKRLLTVAIPPSFTKSDLNTIVRLVKENVDRGCDRKLE